MLSPASLRVCCLAVMAPALTKADRQADCLPVVLSESFCVAKTSDTYNITTKLSDNRQKCAYYPEYSHNKRPFMHRACWRTQKSGSGILCKYRTVGNDSCKSLLLIKGVRTLAKYKTWQSTKATTAYAGKIKLKYTMNKNTSNGKNMGLAKANTSLGLQKKLKRFSKENQSSGPINVMDDSLNFSDSTDSPMPMAPLTDIPNSDCDTTLVENVPLSCNHGRTSDNVIQTAESKTVVKNTESVSLKDNDSEPFLSAGADSIEVIDTSVTLTDMLHLTSESNGNLEHPETSISELPCNVQGTCAINIMAVDTEVNEPHQSTVVLQSESENSILEQPKSDINLHCELNLPEPLISKPEHVLKKMSKSELLPTHCKYSGHAQLKYLTKYRTMFTNSAKISRSCDKQVSCPVIRDCRFGSNLLIPVRQEKTTCCSPSSQVLDSLKSTLTEKTSNIGSSVSTSTRLCSKYLIAHIKKQIGSLVEYYQRILQIPCQRPLRHAKSVKHLQDIQAENRQNEAMKQMSSSESVRFVQSYDKTVTKPTLLSSGIPDTNENVPLNFDPEDCEDIKHTTGVLLSAFKNLVKTADPYLTEESSEEDYKSECNDEETASASESETTTENENALWKYMLDRTKLGSRSTWLLARIHELEFKIKEFSDSWNELTKLEGSVCLEEPTASLSSPECDETDLQTSVIKNFILPLNGFLDRNDSTRVARESLQSELDGIKSSESDSLTDVCCRTRPLNTNAFRKRKLVVIPGLHNSGPSKLSRLSTVNCTCNSQSDLAPCILCSGQYHNIHSVDSETMALRDRIAVLDPYFHPILSTEKEISVSLHLENILKTEAKYHSVRPPSPEPDTESHAQMGIKPKYTDLRSHRKLSRYTRSLSAKYRNKHHRTTKHLRKHKLVFGKWRRLHKHALRTRNRFRREAVASSDSSADSPVNSPMSVCDDGFGNESKRRDSQFDIDDVIIPCNSRSGRLVEIQYKEIMTPSWRNTENEPVEYGLMNMFKEEEENMSEAYLIKRHEMLEIEEKEKMKRSALGLNRRKRIRCDSRADSSGANTPDPTSLYNNQDNVFQIPNFNVSAEPASPGSPQPPATPNSAVVSDDSQQPAGNGSVIRQEKKMINPKRIVEENATTRGTVDFDEVLPFEPLQFPLSEEVYEQLLAESDHNKEVFDMPSNMSSFPASPITSSSSTSTVEDEDEDEDASDPEWTVVKPIKNYSEQALVLKFAKR